MTKYTYGEVSNMNIITREEARSQGLTRYFTGVPCKHNHMCERLVSTTQCVECKRVCEKGRYSRNSTSKSEYYKNNRKSILESRKRNYKPRPEYQKEWRESNKDKIKQYQTENLWRYAYKAAKRRKMVRRATPKWFEKDEVKAIYKLAFDKTENEGIKYAVDHIIPICHELVCGLHCKDNLQVITAEENSKKKNKFEIGAG